ncbi:MAG: TraR/DksA C4-type zinc finger protein [Actinobacteria bacterium]|nr:TraR/DksA C4-type zinc finger protein [Actinomycetota bacterium]MCL5446384.1 TraR/DksA C4-type zinc finger protein [Actinomycetota bacterium]
MTKSAGKSVKPKAPPGNLKPKTGTKEALGTHSRQGPGDGTKGAPKTLAKSMAKPVSKPAAKPAARVPVGPVAKGAVAISAARKPAANKLTAMPARDVSKAPAKVGSRVIGKLPSGKTSASAVSKETGKSRSTAPGKRGSGTGSGSGSGSGKALIAAAAIPAAKSSTRSSRRATTSTTKAASRARLPGESRALPARRSSETASYVSDVKFLEEMREALLKERTIYEEQVEALKDEAESLALEREPGDVQFDEESGEGGTASLERELDLSLSAQALEAIHLIDDALDGIDKGTYGLCDSCHKPISKARLRALPYARLCIECKSGGLHRH